MHSDDDVRISVVTPDILLKWAHWQWCQCQCGRKFPKPVKCAFFSCIRVLMWKIYEKNTLQYMWMRKLKHLSVCVNAKRERDRERTIQYELKVKEEKMATQKSQWNRQLLAWQRGFCDNNKILARKPHATQQSSTGLDPWYVFMHWIENSKLNAHAH